MQQTIWVQLEETPDAGLTVRWCMPANRDDSVVSGTFEEFKNWLQTRNAADNEMLRAVLLLSGEQVVSRSVTCAVNEKKHLQKLLPFMLESQLAVDLSQVHVAHVLTKDSPAGSENLSVLLAYTDRKQLQWRINALESLGIEVDEVFSIPAVLPATQTAWSLLLDNDICHLHAGPEVTASIEFGLLPVLIDAAISEFEKSQFQDPETRPTLTLFVVNSRHNSLSEDIIVRSVKQTLIEHAGIVAASVAIQVKPLPNAWSCLDTNFKPVINLRQGEFAAPLRVKKYWKQWRLPAIAAALAVTVVLITAVVETQVNQYRFNALESRIEQRYREVMPEGVLVDAVQQLSAQVSQRRSAGSTQSLTSMLDAMLEPFESADNLSLHRLTYNNSQTGVAGAEIQLNISAPSAAEILQLSENLNADGWDTQAQNISRVGDMQQASLLVRGSPL